MQLRPGTFIALVIALSVVFLAPSLATAQEERLEVSVGHSEILRLARTPEAIIIGDTTIADASVLGERSVLLTGLAVGRTNLILIDDSGQEMFSAILSVMPQDRRLRQRVRVIEGGSPQDGTMYLCGPMPGCIPMREADQDAVDLSRAGTVGSSAAPSEENEQSIELPQ